MSDDEIDTEPESLTVAELVEALESGEITLQEVRENETLRRRISRLVVKQDMEEHRDIYDRLADV